MKKIYLAIAETEDTKKLLNRISDSEIIPVTSKEMLIKILNTNFFMIIAPKEYIDLEKLTSLTLMGTVIILDEGTHETVTLNNNIIIYPSFREFQIDFLTKGLQNSELKNVKKKEQSSRDIPKSDQRMNKHTSAENPKAKDKSTMNSNKAREIDTEEGNFSKPVDLKDFPPKKMKHSKKNINIEERAELIKKRNYSFNRWDGHKIIGVWSPLSANGVTTFIINFAIFLKQYHLNVAVLEALTPNPGLKIKLNQYNSAPENWISFFEALNTTDSNFNPNHVRWVYQGVDWLPINTTDYHKQTWSYHEISSFIESVTNCNVGLVDLPSGEMKEYTIHTLEHLDELWIIIDNRYSQTLEWLTPIKKLLENTSLKISLIFTRCYSIKRAQKIASNLGIPLLTTFPSMDVEIQKNENRKKPLFDNLKFRKSITPSYEQLAFHILGSYFENYQSSFRWKLKKYLPMVDKIYHRVLR
ncbi:hypothetical protein [Neobacillus sp.]|jgi:hypothetical protein|uniref:hypothetical protein n=1 Tax=Neobacillus sp. TaxID=2675273 RepID=UPI0035B55347